MAVTDDQVATLRAQLAGDFDEHRRLLQELDRGAAKTGYTALIAAGFFEAVIRRFGEKPSPDSVIEFVGNIRATTERIAEDLDPSAAERMVFAAVGNGSIDDMDDETRVGTQIILLNALVADEQLDEAGLESFMMRSRALADEWLG